MADLVRYQGEYKCPRCGSGSHDLNPSALAFVVRWQGRLVHLRCAACGHDFMIRREVPRG